MEIKYKSYADVGILRRGETVCTDEPEVRKAPDPGDIREQMHDASTVLNNWLDVATFNIGDAAALATLEEAAARIKANR